MTLNPGERYSIVYREGGEEMTVRAHYRGSGTGDAISRGQPTSSSGDASSEFHWFKIDGRPGYVAIDADDLISYEIAEGYGG